VAVRSNGSSCSMSHPMEHKETKWLLSFNHRYFESFRHFVGAEEQKHRVYGNTEVINTTHLFEIGGTRLINNRWSIGFYLPLASNVRSSLYEHYGNESSNPNARRETKSFGLADIRIAAYRWILDPVVSTKGNIQFGLGLKLSTGDYRYHDEFFRNDSTSIYGPVDQSIQLGDGGTGITSEINSYYNVNKKIQIYANAFYLVNPREQNGVSTARGGTPSAAAIKYGSNVMSVPDQFMFRAGAGYSMNQFQAAAGLRIEGVPAHDVIGGSNGFRRPGYIISAEPVLLYKQSKAQFYLSVPVAFVRNRTQSVPDEIRTKLTGTYYKGDAAFADYTVNFGLVLQLK